MSVHHDDVRTRPRAGAAVLLVAALALALALCGSLSATAGAAAGIRLSASFDRPRLGADTPLRVGLRIDPLLRPSPLVAVHLLYPDSLGIATSGLGLDTCGPAPLAANGPAGCSPNAVMGYGTATVQARFGPVVISEDATIAMLAGGIQHGSQAILYYVEGDHPLGVQLVYDGLIAPPAGGPFGGDLQLALPPIPGLPPDIVVSLTRIGLVLGPSDLRYYERRGRKLIAYHPQGITVPDTCPRGGFRFRALLTFKDGSTAVAPTAIPCPRPPARRR